jgi:asparagine synthase (glutamine-hydrolysing)
VFDQFQNIAKDCRVVLSGEGSDNLMHFEITPYVRDIARRGEWINGTRALIRFLAMRRFPTKGLHYHIRRLLGGDSGQQGMPPWLNPEFAARTHIEARWKEVNESFSKHSHPILPRAHASLSSPLWTSIFEQEDPGSTRHPVEVRYPFLDARLIGFLLALPPLPWFYEKRLLRRAMETYLPGAILRRPKQSMQSEPLTALLQRPESKWVDEFTPAPELSNYVVPSAIPRIFGDTNCERATANLRPLSLNFWLQSVPQFRYNCEKVEAANG